MEHLVASTRRPGDVRGRSSAQSRWNPRYEIPSEDHFSGEVPKGRNTPQVCGKDANGNRLALDVGKNEVKTLTNKYSTIRHGPRLHGLIVEVANGFWS